MKPTKTEERNFTQFAFGHTKTSCISFSGYRVPKQRDDIDGLFPGCSGKSGLRVEGLGKTSEGLGLSTTNSLTARGVDQGQRKAKAGKSKTVRKKPKKMSEITTIASVTELWNEMLLKKLKEKNEESS